MVHHLCFLFLVFLLFLQTQMKLCNGMSIPKVNSLKTNDLDAMVKRVCGGNISDCPESAVEEEIDSESNRRVLVFQKRYISYDTLKRDTVPCSKPGASYYNCKGVANSYSRGCEVITRCARGDCGFRYWSKSFQGKRIIYGEEDELQEFFINKNFFEIKKTNGSYLIIKD
ncbi:Protein RALF-like 24 [Forsythia ovata]|uniref:Protein RALF-like 24 n=1 Tax=Forsythia ovata TaxID=205694 RepID=A0ABD1T7N7_9LAMI